MIHVSMTSPEGVTLATAGTYCEENVRVTPGFDFAENSKTFEVTLTGNTANSTTLMVKDNWLAAHYSDPDLCASLVKVSGDTTTTGSVIGNFRTNSAIFNNTHMGLRLVANNTSNNSGAIPLNGDAGTGYIKLLEDGSIVCISGSTVRFLDGTYIFHAWLARNGK